MPRRTRTRPRPAPTDPLPFKEVDLKRILLLTVGLAACTQANAPGNTAATPAASTTPTATAPASTATPEAPVTPRPGAIKTFGDWAVACDNVHRCAMTSLGDDFGVDWPKVAMTVTRAPGPEGGFDLAFDALDDKSPVPDAVSIDGRHGGRGGGLTAPPAAAIVAAMANAKALAILSGPRTVSTVSLHGAAASLRYIDAEQGRAGTVTAVMAKGDAPASHVPAAAALPVVRMVTPNGRPAAIDTPTLNRLRKQAGCEMDVPADNPAGTMPPEAHALGGGRTLLIVPCSMGAYNLLAALFVSQGEEWRPVRVDAPIGFAETGAEGDGPVPELVNAEWKDGILSGFAKGRGLGDCGLAQSLVWDGVRLRLTEQSEMRECRGNPHYLTTWRTRVVRD